MYGSVSDAVAGALADYDRLHAEWLAGLSPERLAVIEASKTTCFRVGRRMSIWHEPSGVVARSIYPYVGFIPLSRKS